MVNYMKKINFFIGWKITRTLVLQSLQTKSHTQKRLLLSITILNCNAVVTPLSNNADHISCRPEETPLNKEYHDKYRSIVGGPGYLSACTRPDIAFSVSSLATSLHAPLMRHPGLAKRIYRYLPETLKNGLSFEIELALYPESICVSSDSHWGQCKDTRKSVSGYIIAINFAPIY